jgi:hypothetical protein
MARVKGKRYHSRCTACLCCPWQGRCCLFLSDDSFSVDEVAGVGVPDDPAAIRGGGGWKISEKLDAMMVLALDEPGPHKGLQNVPCSAAVLSGAEWGAF